jgi:glycosyltransferase involved in cell wall biosynthesis
LVTTGERLCVAQVSNSRQAWGAEVAFMALAGPLADRGIDVVLASPPGGDLEERWTKTGRRHVALAVPDRQGIRAPGGRGAAAGQLAAEVMATVRSVGRIVPVARTVDLVQSSSLWTHLDCAVAGRLARRPVVLDLHDIVRPGRGRQVLTGAVRLSAAAVAISGAVADCVGPSAAGRVRIMAPAVDLERFRPGPADPEVRRRLSSSASDPLVGIVGRIDPEKGVDLLVEAVAALGGAAGRARLVVVGTSGLDSGGYRERLEADAGRLLGDRVRFVGRTDDVPATLRALDVLVNASAAEPFGLSVLEAQACGVPVVASRSGGVTDFLTDGENALLVPPGDAGALAGALERVLSNPDLAARLAARGRAGAEEGHGIESFADELAGLYRSLAGLSRRRARRAGPGGPGAGTVRKAP